MLGAIIGDIVGSVYEFNNYRAKDFQPFFHPKAFFTDDTVCTIAVAPALWIIALACFLQGLGFYLLHNVLQTHATQMSPQRRGTAVSAFALSYFTGQAIGVAVAGWAIHFTGTTAVLILAACGVFLTGLVYTQRLASIRSL